MEGRFENWEAGLTDLGWVLWEYWSLGYCSTKSSLSNSIFSNVYEDHLYRDGSEWLWRKFRYFILSTDPWNSEQELWMWAQKCRRSERSDSRKIHILKSYSCTSLYCIKGYIWHTYTKLLTYSFDINHNRLQKFHTYDTVDQRSAGFWLFIIITQLLPGQIFRDHTHKWPII